MLLIFIYRFYIYLQSVLHFLYDSEKVDMWNFNDREWNYIIVFEKYVEQIG